MLNSILVLNTNKNINIIILPTNYENNKIYPRAEDINNNETKNIYYCIETKCFKLWQVKILLRISFYENIYLLKSKSGIDNLTITDNVVCEKKINRNLQSRIKNLFVINLKKRSDLLKKLSDTISFIKKQKINVHIIEGCDMEEKLKDNPLFINKLLKDKILNCNGLGFRKNKNSFIGEIGCYLAHKKCWEKIVKEKIENVLIIEDGVEFNEIKFNPNFNHKMDITFCNKEMEIQSNILAGWGLQSYILTLNGAKKILSSVTRYLCR